MEIPSGMDQGGQSVGGDILEQLERKWYSQLREVAERIDGMAVFAGGRWLRYQMECVEFSTKNIPKGKFQWFMYIVV